MPVPQKLPSIDATQQQIPSLGERLRRRRKLLGLTLQQVASGTGLSVGFLSQIERGKAYPSLVSLGSICSVLSMEISDFFKETLSVRSLQANTERMAFGLAADPGAAVTYERLTSSFPGHKLLCMISYEPPGYRSEPTSHDGEEFYFVLAGAITVEVEGEVVVLEVGDSAHFPSILRHATWNHTLETATIMQTCTIDIFGEERRPDLNAARFVVTRAADRAGNRQ